MTTIKGKCALILLVLLVLEILGSSLVSAIKTFKSKKIPCDTAWRTKLSCDERKECHTWYGDGGTYQCYDCLNQTFGIFNHQKLLGYCFKVINCEATGSTILDMQHRPTTYDEVVRMMTDIAREIRKPVQLPMSSNTCAKTISQSRQPKEFWASDSLDRTGTRLAFIEIPNTIYAHCPAGYKGENCDQLSNKPFKCQKTCSWYVGLTLNKVSFDEAKQLQSQVASQLVKKTYFPRFDGLAASHCFNAYIGLNKQVWVSTDLRSESTANMNRQAFIEIDGQCTVTLPGESGTVPVPGQPRMEMVMFLSPLPVTYAGAERVCEFNGAKVLPNTFKQNAQDFENFVLRNSQSSWLSPPIHGVALATDGQYHPTTLTMPRVLCQRDVRAGDTSWPNFIGNFTTNLLPP